MRVSVRVFIGKKKTKTRQGRRKAANNIANETIHLLATRNEKQTKSGLLCDMEYVMEEGVEECET